MVPESSFCGAHVALEGGESWGEFVQEARPPKCDGLIVTSMRNAGQL